MTRLPDTKIVCRMPSCRPLNEMSDDAKAAALPQLRINVTVGLDWLAASHLLARKAFNVVGDGAVSSIAKIAERLAPSPLVQKPSNRSGAEQQAAGVLSKEPGMVIVIGPAVAARAGTTSRPRAMSSARMKAHVRECPCKSASFRRCNSYRPFPIGAPSATP